MPTVKGGKRIGSGRKKLASKKAGLSVSLSESALNTLETMADSQGISRSEVIDRLLITPPSSDIDMLMHLLAVYGAHGSSVHILEALRPLWEQYGLMPMASDTDGWKVYDKLGPGGFRAYKSRKDCNNLTVTGGDDHYAST